MPAANLNKDPKAVAQMFDAIANKYDFTNGIISLGQDRTWRRGTVKALAPAPGMKILDLAAGTGASSEPLFMRGAQVVSSDFSLQMLKVGTSRHPELTFLAADATSLPFADATFDAVTISFGLRNVIDPQAAILEMYRVLVPGGRIVINEFSHPTFAPFRRVYFEYLMKILPRVAGIFTSEGDSYEYLADSIRNWPTQVELGKWLLAAGFEQVAYRNFTGGVVALHRGTKP